MKQTMKIFSFGSLTMLMLLAGCSTKTLFQSNFDPSVIGQPPLHAQTVGTAEVSGGVTVVGPPVLPSGKWVEISRPDTKPGEPPSPLGILQGNFSQAPGTGTYYFSTFLYIPTGSGNVATIQFDQFGWPVSDVTGGFLHLDFMPDNRVRIDDNAATTFGTFPRNQVFVVQVTLNINPSASTAHITLSGAGASGDANYAVIPPLQPRSLQFGAVKLWMGFPWTGTFDATQIVVTYKAP
jgi:hypothetical protein